MHLLRNKRKRVQVHLKLSVNHLEEKLLNSILLHLNHIGTIRRKSSHTHNNNLLGIEVEKKLRQKIHQGNHLNRDVLHLLNNREVVELMIAAMLDLKVSHVNAIADQVGLHTNVTGGHLGAGHVTFIRNQEVDRVIITRNQGVDHVIVIRNQEADHVIVIRNQEADHVIVTGNQGVDHENRSGLDHVSVLVGGAGPHHHVTGIDGTDHVNSAGGAGLVIVSDGADHGKDTGEEMGIKLAADEIGGEVPNIPVVRKMKAVILKSKFCCSTFCP